ncbi:MAG: CHRD domain-containing protein [Burkholderiaceae bacterium]
MINTKLAIFSGLLASLVGLSGCGTGPVTSDTSTTRAPMANSAMMTASLFGANEVPPVSGNANGMIETSLNKQTNVLTWTITYSGLSGPATAGHFHGPALIGTNAGVALPLMGDLASPIKGNATLTSVQSADLMAGLWYVNLHTAAHPNGEIRGQLRP